MRRSATLLALAVLAGCGKQALLQPATGQSAPPAPVWAKAAPTPEEMLTPPPEAAPERVDDIIRRPEQERVDDPFDPPPSR